MTAASLPFTYQPLSSGAIRLVQLASLNPSNTLQCTIQTYSLLDIQKKYHALSYVWGNPNETVPFLVNGHQLEITRNLAAALATFQAKDEQPLFWIDAICIDQKNNAEKTHQVRMMRAIYTQAAEVVVWLGPEEPTDASGLSLIQSLLHDIKSILSSEELSYLTSHPEVADQIFTEMQDDHRWDAVNRIFQRPWMNRVWIIQEYVCATACTTRMGALTMDAADFFKVTILLRQYRFKLATDTRPQPFAKGPYSNTSMLHVLKDYYLSASREEPIGFFNLLVPTFAFQATDPRYKFFALAGLVTDDEIKNIVDYDKSLPEVLLSVAKMALRREGCGYLPGLDTLAYVHAAAQRSGLPSWVPEWKWKDVNFVSLCVAYRAARQTGDMPPLDINSANHLKLCGRVFDSVKIVVSSPPAPDYLTGYDTREYLEGAVKYFNWLQQCLSLSKLNAAYETDEEALNAFWRTLICDADSNYARPGSEYFESFLAWYTVFSILHKYMSHTHWLIELLQWWPVRFATNGLFTFWFLWRLWGFVADRHWTLNFVLSICCATLARYFHGDVFRFAVSRFALRFLPSRPSKDDVMADIDNLTPATHLYVEAAERFLRGRIFCVTEIGNIGLVHEGALEGDKIAVFRGSNPPFTLREMRQGMYKLVGECYVHGAMNNQPFGVKGLMDEDIVLA